MTWFTGMIAYILIWTLTLFTVLPLGFEIDTNPNPAENSPGSPVKHDIKKFAIKVKEKFCDETFLFNIQHSSLKIGNFTATLVILHPVPPRPGKNLSWPLFESFRPRSRKPQLLNYE